MAEPVPHKSAQGAAIPNWVLVAAAAALVIGLAFAEQRRTTSEPVPTVALQVLGGGGATRGVEAGKVTLVDFWATWCGPCRVTMPKVQRIYSDYSPRGVDLLSVATDNPGPNRDPLVKEFLLQQKLTFPVVLDDGVGQDAFRISSLPTMLLVGKDGKVLWRHVGVLSASDDAGLRALMDRSLQ